MPFSTTAVDQSSGVFKANGSFEEIHWTGSSAYSDGFAARGSADAPFSRITANGIRADVDFGAMLPPFLVHFGLFLHHFCITFRASILHRFLIDFL